MPVAVVLLDVLVGLFVMFVCVFVPSADDCCCDGSAVLFCVICDGYCDGDELYVGLGRTGGCCCCG